jgi:hypothetical protein
MKIKVLCESDMRRINVKLNLTLIQVTSLKENGIRKKEVA